MKAASGTKTKKAFVVTNTFQVSLFARGSVVNRNQFEKKIASISSLTASSVCSRAIAISFTIRLRAVVEHAALAERQLLCWP